MVYKSSKGHRILKRALLFLGLLLLAFPAFAQLPGGGLNVPTTPVTGGTSGQCLYINSGKLGSQACSTGSVTTFSAGTTGFTPNSATSGAVTLAGTLGSANGGTGVANNASSTLTISGAFGTTLTVTGTTALTLPTSGTVTALGNTTTGSGTTLVLSTSPSLTTPTLGVATATSINGNTFTTGTYTLTGVAGKILTFNNTLTLAGTDSSTLNIGGGGTLGTAAFVNTGTSGATIPLISTANTWTLGQTLANNVNLAWSGQASGSYTIIGNSGGGFTFNNNNNGSGGPIIFQAAGSEVARMNGTFALGVTGTFGVSALPNTATTSSVCYNTGTGALSYDATIGTCTVSAKRFKDVLSVVDSGALAKLSALHAGVWKYKQTADNKGEFDHRIHVGLYADDVEQLDKRCVGYREGQIYNYDDRCVLAYVVEALNELNREMHAPRDAAIFTLRPGWTLLDYLRRATVEMPL